MIGTLTLPSGTPLRFSPQNRPSLTGTIRSRRKMSFAGRFPCKATVHAFADTVPAVNTRRSGSLYEVLQVKRNASQTEIKTAYRSLAKQYHPDASHVESADGRDFIKIHNAYATLSDPEARELYDLSLVAGPRLGYAAAAAAASAGNRSGYYRSRRWETDQCW